MFEAINSRKEKVKALIKKYGMASLIFFLVKGLVGLLIAYFLIK
jgi:hypothetical protein